MDLIRSAPLGVVVVLALVENLGVLAVALVAGRWLRRRRSSAPARRPATVELLAAGAAVALNAGVTVLGVVLWQRGVIDLRPAGWRTPLDVVVIIAVTDLALWAGHTVAHLPRLYALGHRFHHRTTEPEPMTLFVLHPTEVVGFGALWIGFLAIWPTSWPALALYTALNLAFGTLAHLGVDPLPARLQAWRLFRWVATPTLHLQHHRDPAVNRGFYTTVWDRLFGTLAADYDAVRAGGAPDEPALAPGPPLASAGAPVLR